MNCYWPGSSTPGAKHMTNTAASWIVSDAKVKKVDLDPRIDQRYIGSPGTSCGANYLNSEEF